MIKTYLFIKRNRFRKKLNLYKNAFNLVFDFTTLVYVLGFIGYFVVAIVLDGNIPQLLNDKIPQIERFSIERFWLIVTIIPLTYIFQSNRDPGVLFSSTEYMLLIMPYNRLHIALILTCERWIKSLIRYIVVGLGLFVFTSISLHVIGLYIGFLLLVNMLMTLPQWKLFQHHFFVRVFIFVIAIGVNILNIFSKSPFIGMNTLLLLLVFLQPLLYKTLFHRVDWQRTIAAGDFNIWNMMMLSYVTKVRFKRDKQTSFLQRLRVWKRPFRYKRHSIYSRMWYVYFERNIKIILQLTGTLIVLQSVLLFLNKSYFPAGIALTIFVYTSFLAVLFEERFTVDVLQQLPWDLSGYKKVLLRWALYPSLLFMIPIIIFLAQQPIKWIFPILILYTGTFLFLFNTKLKKSMSRLKRNDSYWDDNNILSIISLILICFSHAFPVLTLWSAYFIYLALKR